MDLMLALLLAFGGGTPPAAAFEAEGVRVDGVLVTGAFMDVRDGAAGLLLASRSAIEPLAGVIAVGADGRTLILSPGIRATRTDAGYVLAAHGRRHVRVTVGEESLRLLAPVTVKPTGAGWDLGSGLVRAGETLAAAQDQDDVDENLKKLNRAADRIQKAPPPQQPEQPPPGVQLPPKQPVPPGPRARAGMRTSPRLPLNLAPGTLTRPGGRPPDYFWFYSTFNPFVSAQAISSEAIRSQFPVSPTGAPSPGPVP
jgi:hypothetical protein